MLKALVAGILLLSTAAWAQESTEVYDDEVDLLAPEEVTATEPAQVLALPSCQDERLLAQVKELLEEYDAEHPVSSIYDRRQRIMKMRFATSYEEEQVSGFTSKNNRVVADKLLMTKINNGLNDNEIRLCKSNKKSEQFSPIYLMIYPHANEWVVEVLNLLENSGEELKVTFMP